MARKHAMAVETLKLAAKDVLAAQHTREQMLERVRALRQPGAGESSIVARVGNTHLDGHMHPVAAGWEKRLREHGVRVPPSLTGEILALAVKLGDRLAELGGYPTSAGVGGGLTAHFEPMLEDGDVRGCFKDLFELADACDALELTAY